LLPLKRHEKLANKFYIQKLLYRILILTAIDRIQDKLKFVLF